MCDFPCFDVLSLPLISYQVYDVRSPNPDHYPPDFTSYINSIRNKIGAETTWSSTNLQVYNNFARTGED